MLTIQRLNAKSGGNMSETIVVGKRVFVDKTRKKVVAEGSAEAAFLFAAPGQRVNKAEALRLGLIKGSIPQANKSSKPEEDK